MLWRHALAHWGTWRKNKRWSRVSFLPSFLSTNHTSISSYLDIFITLSMDHFPQNGYTLVILCPVLLLLMLRHCKNLHLFQQYRIRPSKNSSSPKNSLVISKYCFLANSKPQMHTESKVHFSGLPPGLYWYKMSVKNLPVRATFYVPSNWCKHQHQL